MNDKELDNLDRLFKQDHPKGVSRFWGLFKE